jgi:hypothetical protein
MTTIAALLDRMNVHLQDEDNSAFLEATKVTQLVEVVQKLARQEVCGDIQWRQGVTDTAAYAFDTHTVAFAEVLYDARSLRHVGEQSLGRLTRDWERGHAKPQFWTDDLQAPQTVRLVPQPVLTGSAIPQFPAVPLLGREALNLVAFTWNDPQTDEETFFLLEVLEDWAVMETVAELVGQVTEHQDRQKSLAFHQLAKLIMDALLGA